MGGAIMPLPPCNVGVSQGRITKFGRLGYFDVYASKNGINFYIQGFYDVIETS